ncbi:hypothetical protein ACJX0J_018386, partial [Zea mays]
CFFATIYNFIIIFLSGRNHEPIAISLRLQHVYEALDYTRYKIITLSISNEPRKNALARKRRLSLRTTTIASIMLTFIIIHGYDIYVQLFSRIVAKITTSLGAMMRRQKKLDGICFCAYFIHNLVLHKFKPLVVSLWARRSIGKPEASERERER